MAEKADELITTDDKIAQAKELFSRGSRNYLVKSFNEAADDLSQVCKIYEEIYGEFADQLGMPYFLYAKSLIALAQDENKVIDVPEGEEDGGDDSDDGEDDGDVGEEAEIEDTEMVEDTKTKKEDTNKDKDERKVETTKDTNDTTRKLDKIDEANEEKENGDVKIEDDKNIEKMEEQENGGAITSTENCTTVDDKPGTSNGHTTDGDLNEENEEDDDAAANLQVAWETLELAAKIFERQGESSLTSLAEVYAELAGISFENSHFEAAIADYTKALEIQLKLSEDNRRIIAEIHYKIGLAHLMQNSFDDCVKEMKLACELIEEEISEEKSKEQTEKIEELIKDLEETKQDILAKITEIEETKQQSIEEVKKELSKLIGTEPRLAPTVGTGPSSPAAGASSSSPVAEKPKATDISHLIKRKKPDTTASEASPAKRPAI